MKNAINELNAILESLRNNQKIDPSMDRHQRILDIDKAVGYLSDLTQCTAEEWEEKLKRDNPLIVVNPNGPYAKEFAIEQNRLDMEATNREESKLEPVVTQTFCVVDLARLCLKPQTYAWTEKELRLEIDRRKPAGYSLDKVEEGSDSYLRVATFKRIEDDDLGELDTSKACRLDNPECESCS